MDFRRSLHLTAAVILLAGGAAALAPSHAFAQSSPESDADAADAAKQAQAKADARAAAPPPAIPGAVTDEETATSGHISADMEPTAALFDAINRGDMTSAKEALGRGADLNGKNVLGQSPLDMAIDLNRSDITFLLLSMRNGENGPPVASVATADASSDDGTAAPDRKGRHGRAIASRVRLASSSTGSTAAQQLAADPGTPKPEIGFLGFGGS